MFCRKMLGLLYALVSDESSSSSSMVLIKLILRTMVNHRKMQRRTKFLAEFADRNFCILGADDRGRAYMGVLTAAAAAAAIV